MIVDYNNTMLSGFMKQHSTNTIPSITIGLSTGTGFNGYIDEIKIWTNQ